MFVPLFAVGFVLVVFAALMGAFNRIPVRRWSFDLSGRWVEVRNFVLREEVWVDGEFIPRTRVDGDHFTWARHAVQVDGATLLIGVGSNGFAVHCDAAYREVLVFNSRTAASLLSASPSARPALADAEEPRRAAVMAILTELKDSNDPETLAALPPLRTEILELLGRLTRAEGAAEAHSVLGDSGGAQGVVLMLEDELAPLLNELRQLHVEELDGPAAESRTTGRRFRQVAAGV